MTLAKPLLISFSLLAFASASAYAAGDAKDKSASQAQSSSAGGSSAAKKEGFSKLDKDGDGMIGRSEAAADADAKSRFEQLDKNRDQQLSRQEYDDWKSASAGASAKAGKGGMKASELIGKDVTDSQGEDLGEIKDIVIDMQGGKVHAAVLEFGGTLGLGEKQYAFPISQIKTGKEKDKLVLNVDKEKLKNAEGFSQDEWPAMNDEYWGRVGGKASAGASKAQGGKMNLVRASNMIGQNVQDKSGNDVGEIKDVIVSLNDGQLRNIVIDVNDGGQAMVQAKALTAGTGDTIMLNMSAEQLKSQAKKSGKQSQSQQQGAGASTGGTGSPELPSSGKK